MPDIHQVCVCRERWCVIDTLIGSMAAMKQTHSAQQAAWVKYTIAYASNNVEAMDAAYKVYLNLSSIAIACRMWNRKLSDLIHRRDNQRRAWKGK